MDNILNNDLNLIKYDDILIMKFQNLFNFLIQNSKKLKKLIKNKWENQNWYIYNYKFEGKLYILILRIVSWRFKKNKLLY